MGETLEKKIHYGAIDGLRSIAAIGIVMMHVSANVSYPLEGFFFRKLVASFTDFVFLFMVISGFSLCCGYYDQIVHQKLSLEQFYNKRFAKTWPYFAFLCILDLILAPSVTSLQDVLANLTMGFGFIADHGIEVIGVGWFLGVVFVFYYTFPFFCYLLSRKSRAWLAAAAAVVLNILCHVRFGLGRNSFVYCAMFFLAGGLVFLYKDALTRFADRFPWLVLGAMAAVAAVYYTVGPMDVTRLALAVLMLVCALRTPKGNHTFLCNPVTRQLSAISMEIYLSHMVLFRVIEKFGMTHPVSSDVGSYFLTTLGTLLGTVVFALVMRKLFGMAAACLKHVKNSRRNSLWQKN